MRKRVTFSDRDDIDFYYDINISCSEKEIMNFCCEVVTVFNKRKGQYTRFKVYHYEREGVYVNTPGVGARVEYPRHDVRNDVVVPHFFHLRTCD